MGYILPITHFQYMQYSNRVASSQSAQQDFQTVKPSTAIFPAILHAKSQEYPFVLNPQTTFTSESFQRSVSKENKKADFAPYITGKGALFDQYI